METTVTDSDEQLLPLSEVRNHLPPRPGGKRISTETIARWASRGVGGIVLESEVIGGRRYVSLEALREFRRKTTAARRRPEPPAPQTTALRPAAAAPVADSPSARAAAEGLAAHGI